MFKVGEIAIIQNAVNYPRLNGEEAEIVGPLAMYKLDNGSIQQGWPVKILNRNFVALRPDGTEFKRIIAAPHQLRKKRDPGTDMAWAIGKLNQIVNNIPATIS